MQTEINQNQARLQLGAPLKTEEAGTAVSLGHESVSTLSNRTCFTPPDTH
jgi:hypothetical protein